MLDFGHLTLSSCEMNTNRFTANLIIKLQLVLKFKGLVKVVTGYTVRVGPTFSTIKEKDSHHEGMCGPNLAPKYYEQLNKIF